MEISLACRRKENWHSRTAVNQGMLVRWAWERHTGAGPEGLLRVRVRALR